MIDLKAKSEAEAKKAAIALSLENPGQYVTMFKCFGLLASMKPRLHVFDPSDSAFGWYVLNGIVKLFTTSQKVADQNATPLLS